MSGKDSARYLGRNIGRKIGLARALSKMGYCSRSRATDLIRAGRVSLDGTIRRDPETPVALKDARIAVDGKAIKAEQKIYLMMNKPRGVITTASDEEGRDTVYDILNAKSLLVAERPYEIDQWVAPVGRLDKASEGLLLLTNDSEWAAKIAEPQTHLEKVYHVQVHPVADDKVVQALVVGVKSKDGELLRAKRALRLRAGEKNCWLEIVLDEGRNRQIRRMIEALEFEVLRLIRVAIGPLELGNLAKGAHRPLTSDEKRTLDRAMRHKA